jgi:hypothetical protein
MKMNKMALLAGLATVTMMVGCTKAEAVEASVGYGYNDVIQEEGVKLSLGNETNNIRYGITALANDERVETYGVYAGIPLRVQGTNFEVTPMITTEYYHEAQETIGGVGLGLGYRLSESLRIEGTGTVNRSFDSSDYTGEVYTVGLTKNF